MVPFDTNHLPPPHTAPSGLIQYTSEADYFTPVRSNTTSRLSYPNPPYTTSSLPVDSALYPGVTNNLDVNCPTSSAFILHSIPSIPTPITHSVHPPAATGNNNRAHMVVAQLLDDIAKTAKSADEDYNNCRPIEASNKIDELKDLISQVSNMISILTLTPGSFQAPTPSSTIPSSPQFPVAAPELPHQIPDSAEELEFPLSISSNLGKRRSVESGLDEERTPKAPKMELQISDTSVEAPVYIQ